MLFMCHQEENGDEENDVVCLLPFDCLPPLTPLPTPTPEAGIYPCHLPLQKLQSPSILSVSVRVGRGRGGWEGKGDGVRGREGKV